MAGDEPGYVVEAKRLTALKLAASDDAETAGSDGARAKAETPKALRKRRVAATKRRQEHAASRIQRLFRAYLRGHVWGVAVRELLPPTLERVVLHSDSLHDRATTLRLHWDRNPLSRPVHRFRLQLWKERLQIWVDLLSDRALAAPSDLAHTAVVRDLQPGTAYYFRLRAYNSVMAEEAEAWVEGSFCTDRYVPPRSQPDPHREGKHRDVNRADIVATRRRRRAVDEAKTAEREQRLGTQRAEAAAAAEAAALAAAAVAAAARTAARGGAKHAAGADDDGGGGGDGGGDDAALATAAMRGAAGRGELSSPNTIEAYNAALMHYTVRAARGAGAEESGGGADTVTAGTGAGTGTATPTGANPAAGTGGSDAPYREEKPPPEPQPGDTTERSHCRESKATAVAAPWEIHQDGDGYMYYWNRETEESRWEPPADAAAQEATEQQQRWQRQQQQHQRKTQQQQQQAQGDGSSLDGNGGDGDDDDHLGDPSSPLGRDHGHGWREYTDPSTGHTYYHHAVSGESRWLSPFAAAAAAVGAGVAASKRVGRPQSAAPPKAWSTANPRRASEIRAEAAASKKQHGGGAVASPNSRKQAELQAARQLAKEYEAEAVQADGDGNGVNGDGIDGDGDGGDGDGGDGDGDVNGDAGDDDGAEGDMPPDKSRSPYQPAASPSPWKSLEAATSKNSDDGQASRDSRATRSRRGSSKGKKQKKPTTVARRRSGSGGGSSSSSSMRRSTAQRPPPPGERHPLDAAFGGLRMPAGWEERYDPQGRRYFYNRDSARTQHHFPVEQPRTRKDSWAPDSRAERERLAGSLGVDQDGGGGWVEDMLDEDVDWKGRRNYLAESKRASVAAPGRAGAGWHPSRGSGREGGGGGGGSGSSSRKYRKKTKKGRHIQQRRGGRPTATTAPGTTKKSVPVYSSAHGASQVLVSSSSPRHGSGGDRVPLGGGRRAGDGRQPAAPRMAKEHIQYSFHDVKAMLEVQREAMAGVLMQEQQRRRNRRQRQRSKTRAAAVASALNRQGRNGGVHHEGDGTGETKEQQQQQQQPARPGHRRQESTGSVDSTGTAGSEISEGTARRFLQNVTEESLKRVSNAKIQLYQQLLVSRAQERVRATRTREREERPRPWRAPPPRAGPTGSEQSSGADDGSSSNSNNRTKQKKKKPKDRQLHGGRRRNDEHPPPQQEKEVPEVDEVGGAGGGGGDDAGSHRSHRPRTAGTGSRGTGAGTGAGAGAGGRAHRRPHTASGVGNAHGGSAAAAGARRPRTAMPPRRFLVELGAEYR